MGHLHRQPIRKWRMEYGLEAVVETGTWEGAGVTAALEAGFPLVVTVDVKVTDKARAMRMGEKLSGQVLWHTGRTSAKAMPAMLETVSDRRVLWWLDAHLPERYQAKAPRAPLLTEVTAIVHSARSHARDVIVADDMRLYGRECADGPMPSGIERANRDDLDAVLELLEPTHDVFFDSRDTGYLVALPG